MNLKQKCFGILLTDDTRYANINCILNLGYMTNYGDEIPLSGYNPLNCWNSKPQERMGFKDYFIC